MSDKQRQLEAMKRERELLSEKIGELEQEARVLRHRADELEGYASRAEGKARSARASYEALNLQILLAEFILS